MNLKDDQLIISPVTKTDDLAPEEKHFIECANNWLNGFLEEKYGKDFNAIPKILELVNAIKASELEAGICILMKKYGLFVQDNQKDQHNSSVVQSICEFMTHFVNNVADILLDPTKPSPDANKEAFRTQILKEIQETKLLLPQNHIWQTHLDGLTELLNKTCKSSPEIAKQLTEQGIFQHKKKDDNIDAELAAALEKSI